MISIFVLPTLPNLNSSTIAGAAAMTDIYPWHRTIFPQILPETWDKTWQDDRIAATAIQP
jgi:hypothetical protein